MTTNLMPICGYCAHLHCKPGSRRALIPWRCDAFPDGIPTAIMRNEADHRQPIGGDHGIQFEPESVRGTAYAAMIFDGGLVPRREERNA